MIKQPLSLLPALLLAACTASPTPVPTASEAQRLAEEQAVYAAALQHLYGADFYVILSTTSTGPLGLDETADSLEYASQNLPGLSPQARTEFLESNASAHDLPADMQLGAPFALLSLEQQSNFFSQNQDGWQLFYSQYPQAPGITSLSRPGFDASLDQALVYVGTQSYWLAGAGYFLLLIREGGAWHVEQEIMTWIS